MSVIKKMIIFVFVLSLGVCCTNSMICQAKKSKKKVSNVKSISIKRDKKKIKKLVLYAGNNVSVEYSKASVNAIVTMSGKKKKTPHVKWSIIPKKKKSKIKLSKTKGKKIDIKGKKGGKITLKAKAGKKQAKIKVKVIKVKKKIKKLSVKNKTINLNKGQKRNIRVICSPAKATLKAVSFTSKNKKIARVAKTGKLKAKITALKYGSTYIIAKAMDGSKKKVKIRINIVKPTSVTTSTPTYVPGYVVSPTSKPGADQDEVAKETEWRGGAPLSVSIVMKDEKYTLTCEDVEENLLYILNRIYESINFSEDVNILYDKFVKRQIHAERNINEKNKISINKVAGDNDAMFEISGKDFKSYAGKYKTDISFDKEKQKIYILINKYDNGGEISDENEMRLEIFKSTSSREDTEDCYHVKITKYVKSGEDAITELPATDYEIVEYTDDIYRGFRIYLNDSLYTSSDRCMVVELRFTQESFIFKVCGKKTDISGKTSDESMDVSEYVYENGISKMRQDDDIAYMFNLINIDVNSVGEIPHL